MEMILKNPNDFFRVMAARPSSVVARAASGRLWASSPGASAAPILAFPAFTQTSSTS